MIKSCVLTLVLVISCSGCYILEKLPEIFTISEYSKDKDQQHKLIQNINQKYDALVAAINSGDIKQYTDKAGILKAFEEPISIKVIDVDGQKQERWLYRQAIGVKAKDKVYLYFDSNDKLVKFEQEKIEW